MIIKVPLYVNNEEWIKLLKSSSMKIVKTMIKINNSTEYSNESF